MKRTKVQTKIKCVKIHLMEGVMKNLCFYFPSRSLGGVQILFNYLSERLSEDNNVYIIDYVDGYLASNKSDRVNLLPITNDIKQNIPENSILIMQADNAFNIDVELNILSDTNLVLWYLHPYNLLAILPVFVKWQLSNWWFIKFMGKTIFRYDEKKIKKIITYSHAKNSLFFMDGATYDVCENLLDIELIDPLFVPVITKDYILNEYQTYHIENNTLNLCYLGRVDNSFKLEMLKKVIKDSVSYSKVSGAILTFTIIGDGPGINKIKEISEEIDSISFKFISRLERIDLVDYLRKNVNILFAMGMSALEGAKLKIPTVCIDAAYIPVGDDYKYRWLYESQNYSLGYILRSSYYPEDNKHSFNDIIKSLLSNTSFFSQKTYSYYKEYYNNENNFILFKESIFSSNLTYGEFERECMKLFGIREVVRYIKNLFR